MVKVSIGILAWNEAEHIERTIRSLFEQSIFAGDRESAAELEIICVPNGCEDDTADVTEKVFEECAKNCPHPSLTTRTCEVEKAGKSNAWNEFVHDFSDQSADYLFLMDADIVFPDPDTFSNMIEALDHAPSAHVSVDLPVKDLTFKKRKGIIDRLSLSISQLNEAGPVHICGQLYCGRGDVLRRIWMPVGLTLEDGFLTAMIKTDRFTAEPNADRVVRAPGASHVFEAYTSLGDIFRHQKAVSIGSTINSILGEYLSANTTDEDAGQLIKRRTQEDPDWFNELVRSRFTAGGWWVIPNPVSLRRFKKLSGLRIHQAIVRLPVAIAGFLMDVTVNVAANQTVKKSQSAYFWEKTRDK